MWRVCIWWIVIWGDITAELEMDEREPGGVVLARHWINDGAVRDR
jgi:hypothetical protein